MRIFVVVVVVVGVLFKKPYECS